MKEQDQQIALCELAGWKKCACGDEHCGAWFPPNSDEPELCGPDTSSLDVLHEMRQRLTYEQRKAYTKLRWKISRQTSSHVVTDNDMWKFANFDAAQERECLLRTLNLWKENV